MTWKHKKKEDFLVNSMATNVVVIFEAWALQMLVIATHCKQQMLIKLWWNYHPKMFWPFSPTKATLTLKHNALQVATKACEQTSSVL